MGRGMENTKISMISRDQHLSDKGGCMKYNYEKIILDQCGWRTMVFKLPEELDIISSFLVADAQGDGTWFTQQIDHVLEGREENITCHGNVYALDIHKDFTVVSNNVIDDVEESCIIETAELKQLIQKWNDEIKVFRESQVIGEKLCVHLQPVFFQEMSLNNYVMLADENAWSSTRYAVSLQNEMDMERDMVLVQGMESVEAFMNTDMHYMREKGFICKECKHSLAGPI